MLNPQPEHYPAPSPTRVGILGGSFDPIHLGHLIAAEEARLQLGLGRVVFLTAGVPYLKAGRTITPARQRLQMVRLAISGNPYFEASAMEIDRPGPTYTVDTMEEMRRQFGNGEDLHFIVGWDGVSSFPGWQRPRRILELCQVVGVPRPDLQRPDMEQLEKALPGASQRIVLLDRPLIGISSTDVRARVGRGLSIRYLVTPSVERYIARHGLYRSANPGP